MATNVPPANLGPNGYLAPSEEAILAGVQADQQAALASESANKAGRVAAQLYRNGGDDTSLELFFAGSAASTDTGRPASLRCFTSFPTPTRRSMRQTHRSWPASRRRSRPTRRRPTPPSRARPVRG